MYTLPNRPQTRDDSLPEVLFEKVENQEAFQRFYQKYADVIQAYRAYEQTLTERGAKVFITSGFCLCCQKVKKFKVDYAYSYTINGVDIPNWRESMVCSCGLNNRMRAVYHFVDDRARTLANPRLYIAEQTTRLYQQFKKRFPSLIGSEFLGEDVPPGYVNAEQIRHEDATRLTFSDASLDLYLSFDVFEHIPDYVSALKEAYRVLKTGGALIFSVPFNAGSLENIVRAEVRSDGSIKYLLPKEIHGDPIRGEGALCYYHFGWQLLGDLEAVGFKEPGAYFYLSQKHGYLGGPGMIFCAEKSATAP